VSGSAIPRRVQVTEGDTRPLVIDYGHYPDDPSAASDAELVAWSLLDRAEVMRSPATVAAASPETDGSYRGTISAPVTYLPPGIYGIQSVLTMPDSSLWRVPDLRHTLSVTHGPGDAVDASEGGISSLAVVVTIEGHDLELFDPVRTEDDGDIVRSSTGDPFSTEYVVVGVDGDQVTLQSSGAVTIAGGHGLALGRWYLGAGAPAIQQPAPTSGAVEALFTAVTAEVILINIGSKVGF
jgi:hypothetical protein